MRTPISPTPTDDGAFSPSWLSLKLANARMPTYTPVDFGPTSDRGRVLMICTEERHMTMANGKQFSTGNHPVEMLLPMLHMAKAGFDIDVVTPTGKSVKVEMWAIPDGDPAIGNAFNRWAESFTNPGSVSEAASTLTDDSDYVAVFIPGGHGAMLGLPDNPEVGAVLRWFHETGRHTLSICHGPAALLAANLNDGGKPGTDPYIYDGYEMAAFPDRVDQQTPLIGYMPGRMPWKFGERLENLGVKIVNSKADDTCHVDRRLITAAGPEAADDFGQLAARTLLNRE